MSARPSYDKDLLLRLKMEHPEWNDDQVAAALNEDNRAHNRPVTVSASMVQSAVYRNRARWAAMGYTLPKSPRRSTYIRDLMQLRGFRHLSADENKRSVPLKRLRYCERLALGLKVPKIEEAKARSWEAEMRRSRTVVDLADGRAYVRAAEPWELDEQGNLLGLTARARPKSGEGSVIDLEPDLTDQTERAIWERPGLSEDTRLRLIADLRTASLTAMLDEPDNSPEKLPNGTSAG